MSGTIIQSNDCCDVIISTPSKKGQNYCGNIQEEIVFLLSIQNRRCDISYLVFNIFMNKEDK
jgi:hypothetical protein